MSISVKQLIEFLKTVENDDWPIWLSVDPEGIEFHHLMECHMGWVPDSGATDGAIVEGFSDEEEVGKLTTFNSVVLIP